MQGPLSLGALAVLLSGSSALIPVLADPSQAASQEAASSQAPANVSVATAATSATKLDEPASAEPVSGSVAIREEQGGVEPTDVIPSQPPVPVAPVPPPQPRVRQVSQGQASWYGPGFYGNRTANGEVFRPGTMTAAHRWLPFGTKVRVTNLWNGRSAVVRINDRGPFHGSRVIDLAHGAAQQLGVVASGVAQVKLEVLQ